MKPSLFIALVLGVSALAVPMVRADLTSAQADAVVEASYNAAVAMYPDLKNPSSRLYREFNAEYGRLIGANDPQTGEVDFEQKLAKRTADALGVRPGQVSGGDPTTINYPPGSDVKGVEVTDVNGIRYRGYVVAKGNHHVTLQTTEGAKTLQWFHLPEKSRAELGLSIPPAVLAEQARVEAAKREAERAESIRMHLALAAVDERIRAEQRERRELQKQQEQADYLKKHQKKMEELEEEKISVLRDIESELTWRRLQGR